jgi:hypothetical protein
LNQASRYKITTILLALLLMGIMVYGYIVHKELKQRLDQVQTEKLEDTQSSWDQANHLYTLTGDNLMQTDIIKYALEDLEGGAKIAPPGKIISNDAFRLVSYTYDTTKGNFTVNAKNITGTDIPEGAEDVAPYILTDGVQFLNPNRERPAVEKDGVLEVSIKSVGLNQNGSLNSVEYLLVKGRMLDRSAS